MAAAATGQLQACVRPRVSPKLTGSVLLMLVAEGEGGSGAHDRPYNDTLIGSTTPAEVHVATMKWPQAPSSGGRSKMELQVHSIFLPPLSRT